MNEVNRTALAQWTGSIPWEVFAHARFPYQTNPAGAEAVMKKFINRLERDRHERIGLVYGMEAYTKRFEPTPVHFHFVARGSKPLPIEAVEGAWLETVTGSRKRNQDIIKVAEFDTSEEGMNYVFKLSNGYHGEWNEHNLSWFLPDRRIATSKSIPTRAERRFHERLAAA